MCIRDRFKVMKQIYLQRILESETEVDELIKNVRQSTRNVKRKLENQIDITEDSEYRVELF